MFLCSDFEFYSVRKIDSTAVATELRGFHLRKKDSNSKLYKFRFADFIFIVFAAVILAVGIVIHFPM